MRKAEVVETAPAIDDLELEIAEGALSEELVEALVEEVIVPALLTGGR